MSLLFITNLFRTALAFTLLLTSSHSIFAQLPAINSLKQTASTLIKTSPPKSETESGVAKPKFDLKVGTLSYQARIESGSQTIKLTTKRTIAEENGVWVITEIAQSDQGEARDQTTLEKITLKPLKRSVKQGPLMLDLTFKQNKVIGTMTASGKTSPIDLDITESIISDGAGMDAFISSLPLAENFKTTIHIFNLQRMQPQEVQMNVIGSEKVTVPAGTFEAFKLTSKATEINADTTQYWIAKDTHKILKAVLTLQQAGVTITAELMP